MIEEAKHLVQINPDPRKHFSPMSEIQNLIIQLLISKSLIKFV